MSSVTAKESRKESKKSSGKRRKAKPIQLKVPRTHKPEHLDLEEWQRILRKQFAEQQSYQLKNTGVHPFFSEFLLTNPGTEKTYKIFIRGDVPGNNFCTCPDYRINNLGTCKHIEFTLSTLKKKKGAKNAFLSGYRPPFSEVYLHYGLKREICFREGKDAPPELLKVVNNYFDEKGILKEGNTIHFHKFLGAIPQNNGHEVRCHDDVMDYVAELQDAQHRAEIIKVKLKGGVNNPIFKDLLKTELYPYQKEGALFAVKAGRCLIGDDMGLGKTIQALTAAELMAELFKIRKVLVVSPTSLKHQWKMEIDKF